jgi:uroporphyrinogen-III synthase
MKLLLTRPLEASSELSAALIAEGHSVLCSPLLDIVFRDQVTLDLQDVQAFIVTSANGLKALATKTERRDLPMYCVGDKTAREAIKAGFTSVKSADGDVDALYQLIIYQADRNKGVLLHAGGARLAGDLKSLLEKEGFSYRREILYDANEAKALTPDAVDAIKAEKLDGVLLFSPHTAKVFAKVLEAQNLEAHIQKLDAWCLSQNVADELAAGPFANIYVARHPSEQALLDLIRKSNTLNVVKTIQQPKDLRGQIVSETSGKGPEKPKDEKIGAGASKAPGTPKTAVPSSNEKSSSSANAGPSAAGSAQSTVKPATGENTSHKSYLARNLIVVLVVFCLGVAAWPLILPTVAPILPEQSRALLQGYLGSGADNQLFEQRLTALENATTNRAGDDAGESVEALKSEISNARSEAVQTRSDLADLANRLGDLDIKFDQLSGEVATIQENVAATSPVIPTENGTPEVATGLSSEIEGLQLALENIAGELKLLKQGQSLSENDMAAQKSQLETLQAAVANRLEKAQSDSANGDEALILLTLGQLHRESRTNAAFSGAWQQAMAVIPEPLQPELAKLSEVSKSGAATLRDLTESFGTVAIEATQSARLPSSETWYGKTLHNLASLVKFRRVGDTSSDTVDAKVALAESKLLQGDLNAAVQALKTLEGAPADVMAIWLVKAEQRLSVDETLNLLLGKVTASAVQETQVGK